jgi:hypothetical protein
MGCVYEHWRPDTNECFYVGASRDDMDERPYFYGHRNDDYDSIVAELADNGMGPFTKIIWDNLVYETTGAYEKMRIAYQRALLGDKLTNKALGGFGFGIDWTDEQRAKHSEILTKTHNTDEYKKLRSEISIALWEDEEFKNMMLAAMKLGQQKFRESPEFNAYVEKQREIAIAVWSDLDRRAEQSAKITESWSDPELIESQRARCLLRWEDKEFREKMLSILRSEEKRKDDSEKITALWKTQGYRDKMMLHAWWLSNVRDRKYWGA